VRAKKPYKKRKKRIGFGESSGHGKTSTKGHKGQRARSGFTMRSTFEGGQTPVYRKVAKRGFNQPHHKEYAILNLDEIQALNISEIKPELLREKKLIKVFGAGLKVLGRGKLSNNVTVYAHKFSVQAKDAIEKAGGRAVLITEKS